MSLELHCVPLYSCLNVQPPLQFTHFHSPYATVLIFTPHFVTRRLWLMRVLLMSRFSYSRLCPFTQESKYRVFRNHRVKFYMKWRHCEVTAEKTRFYFYGFLSMESFEGVGLRRKSKSPAYWQIHTVDLCNVLTSVSIFRAIWEWVSGVSLSAHLTTVCECNRFSSLSAVVPDLRDISYKVYHIILGIKTRSFTKKHKLKYI